MSAFTLQTSQFFAGAFCSNLLSNMLVVGVSGALFIHLQQQQRFGSVTQNLSLVDKTVVHVGAVVMDCCHQWNVCNAEINSRVCAC